MIGWQWCRARLGALGGIPPWPLLLTGVLVLALVLSFVFLARESRKGSDSRDASEGFELLSPRADFPWGANKEGENLRPMVLAAAGRTTVVAICAWLIAFVLGTILGLQASAVPGSMALGLLRRFHDAWSCFPLLFVAAVFVLRSGGGFMATVIVLGLLGTIRVSAEVFETLRLVRQRMFYRAAKATGLPAWRVWMNYSVAHAAGTAYSASWTWLPAAFLWEASLGFIAGTQGRPSAGLGAVLAEGHDYLLDAPWLIVAPGAVLTLLLFLAYCGRAFAGARLRGYRRLLNA